MDESTNELNEFTGFNKKTKISQQTEDQEIVVDLDNDKSKMITDEKNKCDREFNFKTEENYYLKSENSNAESLIKDEDKLIIRENKFK